MSYLILVINPGSTSTKLALFEDEAPLVSETLQHDAALLSTYSRVLDQYPMRFEAVRGWLDRQLGRAAGGHVALDAVAARGGLLRPLPSGTYLIDGAVVEDLLGPGARDHASNLAAAIAWNLAEARGIPAFTVDPVSVDEMEDVARVCGLPELERESLSHALSMKAAARRAAADLGRPYADLNLVVVHLGGGISVSAHRQGRMVDVNNANDQSPFSPERAGTLPLTGLMRMLDSTPVGRLRPRLWGRGGLVAHLGTNDAREVERRMASGDVRAELVYRAMAYQVAKEIGAMSAVLGTPPDAIVLTGGLAYSELFTRWVAERVSFLGRILLYPGGDEMSALASGAVRVLRCEEEALRYGPARQPRISVWERIGVAGADSGEEVSSK